MIKLHPLINQRGQSLVQVMVASAIMGVVIMAIVSTQTSMTHENRSLTEKLSALDLNRVITGLIANSAVCNAIFRTANLVNPSNLTFNATNVSNNNRYVFPVRSIPRDAIGTPLLSIAPTLPQVLPVSPLSNSLMLMPLDGNPPGIQISVSSVSSANLLVNFIQNKLARSIHNLNFPLTLVTTGPVAATKIIGCTAPAVPVGFGNWEVRNIGQTYQAASDGYAIATIACVPPVMPAGVVYAAYLEGFTDSSSNPTTLRVQAGDAGSIGGQWRAPSSLNMPVRKGDYWKVSNVNMMLPCTNTLHWLPTN